ncbi:hypothetical protein AAZX31_09G181600 [Glycine max]|uniref:Uncharacterized protein n=2 Tax=Glycine subgen. Soja TaxID=1462606 RepID=I1L4R7_SOYBN|nr:uncharacterized protein LOC114368926 [Glycine soja]XP_040860991.1 uncharacterized protein LOC100818330 [Glycine max]KAG4992149.1 hypothetical protein JHK87_025606 [Glycine soja]KAG5013532.1 hypothetical protein JHK86_025793 [Glycine max]KAG5134477.1 hypothetical protein JHK82_025665 [Glycine max]KAH1043882.1 hypothetical protein GYH30_025616 [Glycine max]KHN38878.1 hypothetical protein glysoja_014870 [Glycine soja]|eukprot:XP_003534240.1 uncharacterized protein LOC100818330 [Glycine max]
MAVSLTRLSWWLWGSSKEKEPVSSGSTLNSSSEWSFKERETVKFPSVKGTKIAPSHRKVKRKWQSREERRHDREYDVVLVPSDGDGCLSSSESDDSDFSIGWLEPHGSDFLQSDDDLDNSFAVLVPCYRKEVSSSNKELLSVIKNLPNEFSSAGKNYMEHWLASLQNLEA